jgi:hypothetical protein
MQANQGQPQKIHSPQQVSFFSFSIRCLKGAHRSINRSSLLQTALSVGNRYLKMEASRVPNEGFLKNIFFQDLMSNIFRLTQIFFE